MAKFELNETVRAFALWALGLATSCGGSDAPNTTDGSALDVSAAETGVGFEPPAEAEGPARVDATVGAEAYAGPCYIDTGDYDQSCSVDSDCVGTLASLDGFPIQSGDYLRTVAPRASACLLRFASRSMGLGPVAS
jgi:hypothetical protein